MRLNSLQLDGFRGATRPITIPFDPSKPITMIFGENGNGKSTISDALTCLLTTYNGSIDDKSSTKEIYLKTIGKEEAKITLDTSDGICKAIIRGNGKNVERTLPENVPQLRVLRRSHITKLINAEPKDRFDELKEYLDLSEIVKCEEELNRCKRSEESDYNNLVGTLSKELENLEEIWLKEGSQNTTYIDWAAELSEQNIGELEKESKILKIIQGGWSNISTHWAAYLVSKKKYDEAHAVYLDKSEIVQLLQQEDEANETTLLELLQEAEKYISGKEDINSCPVCSNDIGKDDVLKSIQGRIASLNNLGIALTAQKDAFKLSESIKSSLQTDKATFNSHLFQQKEILTNNTHLSQELNNFFDRISGNVEDNIDSFSENKPLLDDIAKKVEEIEEKKSTKLKLQNTIKVLYNSIKANTEKSERLERLVNALSATLEIVVSTRKQFITDELRSIAEKVDDMYAVIHPGEEIGDITLSLKNVGKSSLELAGKFYTETDIAPQSLYSESHLDTLALCIFLALAEKYGDENTIVVLDDVVMSVDHNHLEKIIELITNISPHFSKIIVTTHYQKFREQYKRHRAPGLSLQFLELRPWSLENGIRILNGKVELEEFVSVLKNEEHFDRQSIASKSGVLLENLLDFLSDVYEYNLPKRTSQKYTLGEYLDALQPKYLKDIYVVQKLKGLDEDGNEVYTETTIALQPTVEEIKKLAFIRNEVGAHFNLDQNVLDSEIETLGNKTLELAKMLICNETGELPLYKGSDHWSPKSNNIKLYPREKK